MKVFCRRSTCRFIIKGECRTSSISVGDGGCSTYQQESSTGRDGDPVAFWGHLSISPPVADPASLADPAARPETAQD